MRIGQTSSIILLALSLLSMCFLANYTTSALAQAVKGKIVAVVDESHVLIDIGSSQGVRRGMLCMSADSNTNSQTDEVTNLVVTHVEANTCTALVINRAPQFQAGQTVSWLSVLGSEDSLNSAELLKHGLSLFDQERYEDAKELLEIVREEDNRYADMAKDIIDSCNKELSSAHEGSQTTEADSESGNPYNVTLDPEQVTGFANSFRTTASLVFDRDTHAAIFAEGEYWAWIVNAVSFSPTNDLLIVLEHTERSGFCYLISPYPYREFSQVEKPGWFDNRQKWLHSLESPLAHQIVFVGGGSSVGILKSGDLEFGKVNPWVGASRGKKLFPWEILLSKSEQSIIWLPSQHCFLWLWNDWNQFSLVDLSTRTVTEIGRPGEYGERGWEYPKYYGFFVVRASISDDLRHFAYGGLYKVFVKTLNY